jgi:hypothetical protein
VIQGRNKAKKRLRPVGHRSVEVGFDLCFQQKWVRGVGWARKALLSPESRVIRNQGK